MNFKIMSVVFKKEIKDMFRDKKTIILGILIPLLIFPVMYGFMGKSMEDSQEKVQKNLKIAIKDEGNSSFNEYIKSQENITIIKSQDLKKDVQDGKIYAGIEIPKDFDDSIKNDKQVELKIVYDDASQNSSMAMDIIKSMADTYSKGVVKERLIKMGVDESILTPMVIKEDIVAKEKTNVGRMILSMMLPLFLIIYSISSPMAAATDLGAGEKERGTLEPLLTTKASRMNLLFGKFFAITLMGLIGTIASITGLLISFKTSPSLFGGDASVVFPAKTLIIIAALTIFVTMIFGALELSVSIYARSFKEAQTYLSPLSIVGMAAAFSTYMIDVKDISPVYLNIPIVNISVVLKEIINGIYNPMHIILTFVWSGVYITISILFARYMFSKEEVIFRT
ncbi:MAG TPA: ABC transporter permease [Clostridiaceae bacterium]|jgi:sodium transport system permease protein|nr:ABC transporter permease [Clostridiaceae bacterium]HBF77316.1 ABC transporter permease [Clostridiaceae bacterium]HBG37826.1 ABC transporter permease [Clostridiaceae bacterium]